MTISLDDLNAMDQAAFTGALGGIFEHSPWIAEQAWERRPFSSVDSLLETMLEVVSDAGEGPQLELIRAHPDLAGKAARAGALTEHSTREQSGVGLDRLSDEEFDRFHRLNDAYKDRFGFPFIIAVRDHTKDSILAAFETRLQNDRPAEMQEALRNIGLIAAFRLGDVVAEIE